MQPSWKFNRRQQTSAAIERYVLAPCIGPRKAMGEYALKIAYYTDESLDKILADLSQETSKGPLRKNASRTLQRESKARIGNVEYRANFKKLNAQVNVLFGTLVVLA